MPYEKTILCLANSTKMSGRCIAGKEIINSQFASWIRPVSARETHEISWEDRHYHNGSDVAVMDVVTISFNSPAPTTFQHENHLINDTRYWVKVRQATWIDALNARDQPPAMLWNTGSSSYNGKNDRVAEPATANITQSLYLIQPTELKILVAVEGEEFGNAKRKVRTNFKFNGVEYEISVTDPAIKRQYLAGNDGVFTIDQALVCVSLGEIWNGYAYKLAAAIILPH